MGIFIGLTSYKSERKISYFVNCRFRPPLLNWCTVNTYGLFYRMAGKGEETWNRKKSADLNYRGEQFDKKDRKKSVWSCGRGAAGLLTMAFLLQPFPVLAGPASDITAPSGGNGPAGAGSSSQSATAGAHQTAGFTGGVSAVTSGLGTYVPTEEFGIGAIARGIDVSYWQQNIDWSQVASDNVQFAMLATRFRGNVDPFLVPMQRGPAVMASV